MKRIICNTFLILGFLGMVIFGLASIFYGTLFNFIGLMITAIMFSVSLAIIMEE